MKINLLPPREYLLECFSYENGILVWKTRPREHFQTVKGWNVFNSLYPGKFAGRLHYGGYLVTFVKGKMCLNHRIVWKMLTGFDPVEELDHINRVKNDNRIENLREASRHDNQHNISAQKNNKLQVKGVTKSRSGNFEAHVHLKGKKCFLGTFFTLEEAKAAYDQAARLHHGEFFRP
jgi:hypothetical protein